jgi:hypothetical protein
MVQKAVTQLVRQQAHQHCPRDLIPMAPAHYVALLDLDDTRVLRVNTGDAGAQQHPIAPILDARDQKEAPDTGKCAGDQVPSGRVGAAPGTCAHPVIYPPRAAGALAFEKPILVPALRPAAPGAVPHGVLNPATAAPIAACIHAEATGSLQWLLARVSFLMDVRAAPRTRSKLLRHCPPAFVALSAGHSPTVTPPLCPAAGRAEVAVARDPVAADAALIPCECRRPAPTCAHTVLSQRLQSAE